MKPARIRRLGIVGCGAIGSLVARLLEKKKSSFRVTALFDINRLSALKLSKTLKSRPVVCDGITSLLSKSDIVLEAATVQVSLSIATAALKKRNPS